MGKKELFCFANYIILLFFFTTLLNLPCVKFEPRLYLLFLTKARLEDLKLYFSE